MKKATQNSLTHYKNSKLMHKSNSNNICVSRNYMKGSSCTNCKDLSLNPLCKYYLFSLFY